MAFADPDIELVAGSDIIFYDGTTLSCYNGSVVACSTFGATATRTNSVGVITETVTASSFNGWNITSDNGQSFSPPCSVTQICLDQTNTNVTNAGASSVLESFFAASGFTPRGPLLLTEALTAANGTATTKGYAYGPNGTLGLSATAAPTLPAPFGTLSLTGFGICPGAACPVAAAGPVSGTPPASPYNQALEFDFTAGAVGGEYSATETISASAAVPEPASVVLLGGVLLAVAAGLRRRATRPWLFANRS